MLEDVAQRGCRVSLLGSIQNPQDMPLSTLL